MIFLHLDYESYKNCLEVKKFKIWHDVQTSDRFVRLGKHLWHKNILRDKKKLNIASTVFADGPVRTGPMVPKLGLVPNLGPVPRPVLQNYPNFNTFSVY